MTLKLWELAGGDGDTDAGVPYVIPEGVDDTYLSRLPLVEGQYGLRLGGVDSTRAVLKGTCGWHHTRVSPETGWAALVREDGPLADLVGERVLVGTRVGAGKIRVIAVAVLDSDVDMDEDISLSRRAFAQIALLASEEITVQVAVLA